MSLIKLIVFGLITLVTITTAYSTYKDNHFHSKKRFARGMETSSTGSPLPNLDPAGNKTLTKKSLKVPYVKAIGKWQGKRAGHSHKTKKVPSVSYSNYYDPEPKQSSNRNYGNRGYEYQSQSSPSKGYSNLYYSPDAKSNTKPASAQQDYSSLYYAPDTKSKPASQPASSGSYKMAQQNPSYSNYYSPAATKYQKGSYQNKGSGRTQNKKPAPKYYVPPVNKGTYAVKNTNPHANRWNTGQKGNTQGVQSSSYNKPAKSQYKWVHKNGSTTPGVKPNAPAKSQYQWSNKNKGSGKSSSAQDYSSMYYAPDTKSSAASNKQGNSQAVQPSSYKAPAKSQYQWSNKNTGSDYKSQSSPQQGYSNLYYAPDTKSKASQPISSGGSSYYSGNYNNRVSNPSANSQQQWSNRNQESNKKADEPSLSYLNYYGKKRSLGGNLTGSTTTDNPNATPGLGFIAEFFHEHVVGTTTKSDGLLGIFKRNVTKRTIGMKRHAAQERLMKRKRKHVQIEGKPEISKPTTPPNATSGLGFIGDFFHKLFGGNTSSASEHKNVAKRQMELKTQNENGKGEKHLVALTFSIREQQVKATFSDSQNVSQSPGKEEEDTFTTPSMEDMLKKENAMLMDLVKVVSNGAANNKLKSNTGASQIASAINNSPRHFKPQDGNVETVGHPKSLSKRPVGKKHTSEIKRTVPGSKVGPRAEQEGNGTQVEKKHVQKETVTKIVQKPKNSLPDSHIPGGGKFKKQKPPSPPSVEEHGPHQEESKDDVKPPEAESTNDQLPGNEMYDGGDDSIEGRADDEVAKDSDVGEDLPNDDDNEIDMAGKVIDGEESMDETDVPKNKNTGTVERVVIEESKKFKSKLTETFEKNAEDANSSPENPEDEVADATEEAPPAGEKKLVDKTAQMMEAMSILYKLAGNESKGNDVIRRDENNSVSGNNSIPGNNSISERDSVPPKDSNAEKDSISVRDSSPPKDPNGQKDSISERDSSPPKDPNAQKDSISERDSSPPKDPNAQKDSISERDSIPPKDSSAQKDSISERDSIPPKDSSAQKDSISERDSIASKDSYEQKDSISERDSIPPKDSSAQKDSISERDSIPPKDSSAQKDSISERDSIPGKENASIPPGTPTTPNPIIENVSIALASSLPTIDAAAKKNRKRKFVARRETNEVTTANGVPGHSTPWTQIIREATQEDRFTVEMTNPPLTTQPGVSYDPADNTKNIADDMVDTTNDDGTLQTEYMNRLTNEEPSTVEIENVGDDFTTDKNMDSII